jgi:hypothetical protein
VGFIRAGDSPVAKNCLASGNTNGFVNHTLFGAASANNASSGVNIPGTNGRINQTFTFLYTAADNFHLRPADQGALGYGANLSDDLTFAFNDDIDGQTITQWSIGFDSIGLGSTLVGGGGQGLLTVLR